MAQSTSFQNLAHRYRTQLQKHHYVQKSASHTKYWSAFHYRKMKNNYCQRYGKNFCLIIAGEFDIETDFYVFPYADIEHLFTEETLSKDKNTSQKRWILSIYPRHRLVVSNAGELDASKYYGKSDLLMNALKVANGSPELMDIAPSNIPSHEEFLGVLNTYLQNGTVFHSPHREAQYAVDAVNSSSAQISRLTANEPVEVTLDGYKKIVQALHEQKGTMPFDQVSSTVAIRVAYLQSRTLALSADRKQVMRIDNNEMAINLFCEYITPQNLKVDSDNGQPRLYKPIIIACVIDAINSGELTANSIHFRDLVPRFQERLADLQAEGGVRQASYAFKRLANGSFWYLSYKDVNQAVRPEDDLSPTQIDEIILHASLKETFWSALQEDSSRERLMEHIERTWWPEALTDESKLSTEIDPFNTEDILRELFISREKITEITSLLERKKNIVLQGPPGVGKTYFARRLAYLMLGGKDETRIRTIQFHQSYSYEDFIQGFRPVEEGGFVLKDGIFYTFCESAKNRPSELHVMIIDEINRGNLSKILGELMMLIEADKRGPEYRIPLTYGREEDDGFYVPENLLLIGTMNTADRSLAMVDYALRRRFVFIDIEPALGAPQFRSYLQTLGISDDLASDIIERVNSLNEVIAKDDKNLGPGYRIGHSYFCTKPDANQGEREWFKQIVDFEIKPLLSEYWFDNREKVDSEIENLLD